MLSERVEKQMTHWIVNCKLWAIIKAIIIRSVYFNLLTDENFFFILFKSKMCNLVCGPREHNTIFPKWPARSFGSATPTLTVHDWTHNTTTIITIILSFRSLRVICTRRRGFVLSVRSTDFDKQPYEYIRGWTVLITTPRPYSDPLRTRSSSSNLTDGPYVRSMRKTLGACRVLSTIRLHAW